MENQLHPFIALEGLSGVGKSSVAMALAAQLNGQVYKTPCETLCSIRDIVDRQYSLNARFLFYLAGVYQASDEIRQILPRHPIICDRYILTTVCYHRSLGVKLANRIYDDLAQPNLTVLLTCSDEERLLRINRRGWSYNDIQERISRVEQALLAEYLSHGVLTLDTTSISAEEAALEIVKHLPKDTLLEDVNQLG